MSQQTTDCYNAADAATLVHASHQGEHTLGQTGLKRRGSGETWEGLGPVSRTSAAAVHVWGWGDFRWPQAAGCRDPHGVCQVSPWWHSAWENWFLRGLVWRSEPRWENLFSPFWKGHRSLCTTRLLKWSCLSITWNLLCTHAETDPGGVKKYHYRILIKSRHRGSLHSGCGRFRSFNLLFYLPREVSFLNKLMDLDILFNMLSADKQYSGRKEGKNDGLASLTISAASGWVSLWVLTNKFLIIKALTKWFPSFQTGGKSGERKWRIHPQMKQSDPESLLKPIFLKKT